MQIYSYSRHIGWFIVTTGIITALPLIFEVTALQLQNCNISQLFVLNTNFKIQVKRESVVEELEKMQVDKALIDGKTPQELASAGLSSAMEPKVLT